MFSHKVSHNTFFNVPGNTDFNVSQYFFKCVTQYFSQCVMYFFNVSCNSFFYPGKKHCMTELCDHKNSLAIYIAVVNL